MRREALLDVWDQAGTAGAAGRAVALAAGLAGAASAAEAAALPVGVRDALLLAAHRRLFARRLDLMAVCPACAEPAGFEVVIDALLTVDPVADWPLGVDHAGAVLFCRRPSTTDIAAAWAGAATLEEARARLCAACVETEDELDAGAVDAVSAALAAADPLADIRFAVVCPACDATWDVPFDPSQALWRALDAWARETLDEVQRLARGYGWSEREVLAMHPHRSRHYLDALP